MPLCMFHLYVICRDLDDTSVGVPAKRHLAEGQWFQKGYADETTSGIVAVVTQVDSLVTQEYLPITTMVDR